MGKININPQIENSWKYRLDEAFNSKSFLALKQFLIKEKSQYVVYPKGQDIFNAFNLTPFDKVKAVIIGQDPYHEPNQAHGLCFSVKEDVKIPPSLVNIFKELHDDIGFEIQKTGNLTAWAQQGILLLNAILTVRAHQAGSHQKKGWETFTDFAIKKLSEERENLVFFLWGRYAQQKETLINTTKHCVLKSVHPSPLSAYNGFFGCKHFSKANKYLESKGIIPIDWKLEF